EPAVVARLLRGDERVVVACEAVVEDRGDPPCELDADSLSACGRLRDRSLDEGQGVRLPAAIGREHHRAEWREARTGRRGDPVDLRYRRGRAREVTPPRDENRERREVDRQADERADLACTTQLADVDRTPCVVVPEEVRRHGREPAPTEALLCRAVGSR